MLNPPIKSKTPKIYKTKKINNANFGLYNLNEYQVFLQLVTKIGKVDELGKYQQSVQLPLEYVLTAQEFSSQFHIEQKHAYSVLKKAVTRLMGSFITLEKPELFETWQIAVCSYAKYNHKLGNITVKFNADIMPYLAQTKGKYILYNLREISNFGSLYSTRLYELLQEFKDTGWVKKSVEQLREIFAVGEKFPAYSNFKIKTFAHAVMEINSQFDINLNFEELTSTGKPAKQKQKVTAVIFTFNPTFIRKMIDPKTGNQRNVYIKPKQKIKQLPAKTEISAQPNHQELPLNETLLLEQNTHQSSKNQQAMQPGTQLEITTPEIADAPPQKEQLLQLDIQQPELSNPAPQKKKRFFGLF